jgi:hypothetical protein
MNDTAECRDFLIFTISAARSNHEHWKTSQVLSNCLRASADLWITK